MAIQLLNAPKWLSDSQQKKKPNKQALEAFHRLREEAPGPVRVHWDEQTGVARSISGILTESRENSSLNEIAQEFLVSHAKLFGISNISATLKPVNESEEHQGVHCIRYQQISGDVVENAGLTVYIDQDNKIRMIAGRFYPDVPSFEESAPDTRAISVSPEQAIEAVCEALNTEERPLAPPVKVILPHEGQYIPVYKVRLKTKTPPGNWVVFVRASNGEIIAGYNTINFVQSVVGSVYKTHPHEDGAPSQVELKNLKEPYDKLSGDYFIVQNSGMREENAIGEENENGVYQFLYAEANSHFDEVMVYYHLNLVANFFMETLNFPEDKHSEPMTAYVHKPDPYNDAADCNCSQFDGHNTFEFGHGALLPNNPEKSGNDPAKDAAVIYHEYVHSVIAAFGLIAGADDEFDALCEGYADYFGCSLTDNPKFGEFVAAASSKKCLRDLECQKTYNQYNPEEWPHINGEIWGATCWQIRKLLKRKIADSLIYNGIFYLPQDANFVDAAYATIIADEILYEKTQEGTHLEQLDKIFRGERKIPIEALISPASVVVNVPGNKAWTDSGITVKIGDEIKITAFGTVTYDKKNRKSCDPGGTSWTDTRDEEDPLWEKPHGGLIGKIGRDEEASFISGDKEAFFIGKELYPYKPQKNGKLWLCVNDFWYQENSDDEFTVTIQFLKRA